MKEEHLKTCDIAYGQLHFTMRKELGVNLDKEHWYEHVPKSIDTSCESKVSVLQNQQVKTDRNIPNSKVGVIIHVNEQGTYLLIDIPIPGDRNVIKEKVKRILIYKNLTMESQHM